MREPSPDYSSRQYERPNQPWVCGLTSDGQACPAGPTERGRCPALAECAPRREGDRWQCNRSELRGGACEEGPTPEGGCCRVNRCHPMRSLRTIRGKFAGAVAMLTAGCVLILLSADWRDAAISPGPLARHHAQILGQTSPDASLISTGECAACHAAAEHGPAKWAASLVTGPDIHNGQSQRCMECHDKTITAAFAMATHNVRPEALRQITGPRSGNPQVVRDIACATCHQEHQGADFDLTAMNDFACQSCHQQKYSSFGKDHPDFGNWPYVRRTRIAFNHASHGAKHFPASKQAFDCRSCHLDDATGRVQLTASYEASCAACHDEKIATSVAQGVPMLGLPTLDVETFKASGHAIGQWPEAASGEFDGKLPPAMKLLLASDPAAGRAIEILGADFDFFDVDPDDAKMLEASAVLAMAIRELMTDIEHRGPAAFRDRLGKSLGRDITDAEARAIAAGLSPEVIGGAARAWFPDEDALPRDWASTLVALNAVRAPFAINMFAPAGLWRYDKSRAAISYRPAAHADPVLTGWLELLATTPNLAEKPLALAMFEELSKSTAPGLCASCHSVERAAGGQLTIHLRAYDRTDAPRDFTKFSHGPHLLLPQLSDCTSCHTIKQSPPASDSYAQWHPHEFESEFEPMTKQQCATCHTASAAGDACQKCHNYHVDEIEAWRLTTSPQGSGDSAAR